ncbi:tryptophan synthase subunit beta domain protein [Campylobacter sp. FOBRC14]|nr:tryptophan synthase subunit beta domain protein [Campylobacter sp. FOBRC14]
MFCKQLNIVLCVVKSYEATLSPPIFREVVRLTAKIVLYVRRLAEQIRFAKHLKDTNLKRTKSE